MVFVHNGSFDCVQLRVSEIERTFISVTVVLHAAVVVSDKLAGCGSNVWRKEVLVLGVHSGLEVGNVKFGDARIWLLMLRALLVVRYVVLKLAMNLRKLVVEVSRIKSAPYHSSLLIHAARIAVGVEAL